MKRSNSADWQTADRVQIAEVECYRRKAYKRPLFWLITSALVAVGTAHALPAVHEKPISYHSNRAVEAEHHKPGSQDHKKATETKPNKPGSQDRGKAAEAKHHKPAPKEQNKSAEADHQRHIIEQPATPLPTPLSTVKQAIEFVRQGKNAAALVAEIGDPVGTKLVEWALLRHPRSTNFDRYAAFIHGNPDWPSMSLLRRRAEARLWQEQPDAATVRRFISGEPSSALGQLALARIEITEDHVAAESKVRAVWQSAQLSAETESALLTAFPGVLTRADHVARMDRRIGGKDFGAAMRAAKRLGDDQVAIVKACIAAEAKSANGGALLNAVRAEARGDLGYALCRVHWLLRNDTPGSNVHGRIVTPKEDITTAAKLMLAASSTDLRQQDTDEWWRERRALARKLLDLGEPVTAYQVAREAAPPADPYYRAEFHFMTGWIALRFLADPTTALTHFAHIDDGMTDPLVLARATYWRGRAAEAAGQLAEMREQYEAAARYPTAYYGQLARARLGLGNVVVLRSPPEPADEDSNELLHAAAILYKIGEGDLALSFVADLADQSSAPALIAGLGKLTARHHDAKAMMLVGKAAMARGLPMEIYAFPDIGVPNYKPVGFQLDRCLVYSIVRTESSFDQRDKSSAQAVGLMQVTPDAGRDTAKRFGMNYDWQRLVSDPMYNTQMGAAEIAGLLKDYQSSFILTFAGYNAGRGRVAQWIAQHGDPRDPSIDAVDWVERIPFAETRNYVQRVMENLQVYRVRFGATTSTVEPGFRSARAGAAHCHRTSCP